MAVSAVSAAENVTDDAVGADDSVEDNICADVESDNLKDVGEDIVEAKNSNSSDDCNDVLAGGAKTFKDLYDDICLSTGDTIYLDNDYVYTGDKYNGISITRPLTIYGDGHTLDGAGSAAIFIVGDTHNGHGVKTTIYDVVFVNGYAKNIDNSRSGGAVRDLYGGYVTLVNCTFIDNHAENYGGAVYKCNAEDCRFVNNSANCGGALFEGKAVNCIFDNNSAKSNGGAIYTTDQDFDAAQGSTFLNNSAWEGGAIYCGIVKGCTFTDNHAEHEGGAICVGTAYNSNFKANSAPYGGALAYCLADNCYFEANSAQNSGGAMYTYKAVNCNFVRNSANCGGAIFAVSNEGCTFRDNVAPHGSVYSNRTEIYIPLVDELYNSTYCFAVSFFDLYIPYEEVPIVNATLLINFNGLENYTTDSNGEVLFSTKGLDPGTYTFEASYAGDEFYGPQFASANITVSKLTSSMTVPSSITVCNVQKYLVVKVKGNDGKAITGNVTLKLSNGYTKTVTTNSLGVAKFSISPNLIPKTYKATIKFEGNTYYKTTTKSVTVKVRSNTKLIASNKAFKLKATKKVTAILKDSRNRVIKNKYVIVKVAGKSYKVKTNSKGVATAKVKITKKGSLTATIKFAGDKYYNKCTKKIKLRIK